MEMEKRNPARPELREAIDRFGSNLAVWPDAAAANAVRVAALADRGVRRYLDGARALDAGLDRVRAALDDAIAASGASKRVADAVFARIGAPHWRARWAAVAAALVIAAGLGSAFDFRVLGPAEDQRVNVVLLDPLVFGPTDADSR